MTKGVGLQAWPDDIYNYEEQVILDDSVQSLDPSGNYILCKKCKDKWGNPLQLSMRRPFNTYRWVKHKGCVRHTCKDDGTPTVRTYSSTTEWPENVFDAEDELILDDSILTLDPYGEYILCNSCKDKWGNPIQIYMRSPFNIYRWKEHKECGRHLKHAAAAAAAAAGVSNGMSNSIKRNSVATAWPSIGNESAKKRQMRGCLGVFPHQLCDLAFQRRLTIFRTYGIIGESYQWKLPEVDDVISAAAGPQLYSMNCTGFLYDDGQYCSQCARVAIDAKNILKKITTCYKTYSLVEGCMMLGGMNEYLIDDFRARFLNIPVGLMNDEGRGLRVRVLDAIAAFENKEPDNGAATIQQTLLV